MHVDLRLNIDPSKSIYCKLKKESKQTWTKNLEKLEDRDILASLIRPAKQQLLHSVKSNHSLFHTFIELQN